jgi:hypothetical protein
MITRGLASPSPGAGTRASCCFRFLRRPRNANWWRFFAHFSLWAVLIVLEASLEAWVPTQCRRREHRPSLGVTHLARLRECIYEEGTDHAQFRVFVEGFESELRRDTNQDNAFRQRGPTSSECTETRIRDHKWVGSGAIAQAGSV